MISSMEIMMAIYLMQCDIGEYMTLLDIKEFRSLKPNEHARVEALSDRLYSVAISA